MAKAPLVSFLPSPLWNKPAQTLCETESVHSDAHPEAPTTFHLCHVIWSLAGAILTEVHTQDLVSTLTRKVGEGKLPVLPSTSSRMAVQAVTSVLESSGQHPPVCPFRFLQVDCSGSDSQGTAASHHWTKQD